MKSSISKIADNYCHPLLCCCNNNNNYCLHAFFWLNFVVHIINTAIQHSGNYWIYIIILQGPVVLFNSWFVCWFQQYWAFKKNYALVVVDEGDEEGQKKDDDKVIIWTYGSLSMIKTKEVSDDIKLALIIPMGYGILILGWLLIYALFDGFAFDETILAGVDYDELSEGGFVGIMANVAAQSVWRCVTFGAINLIVPLYPIASSAILGGFLFQKFAKLGISKMTKITDGIGMLMNALVLIVGTQQLFWDDNNGLGVDTFVNSIILIVLTIPRLLQRDHIDNRILFGRPCYHEIDREGSAAAGTTTPAPEDNNVEKEQELTETTSNIDDDYKPEEEVTTSSETPVVSEIV